MGHNLAGNLGEAWVVGHTLAGNNTSFAVVPPSVVVHPHAYGKRTGGLMIHLGVLFHHGMDP